MLTLAQLSHPAQVGGVFLIFVLGPIIGALPLAGWIVEAIAHKKLKQVGTGNVGISAAFYHGGTTVGVLCVLAEIAKSITVVLLARSFFPPGSTWEIIALIALVMGRYWGGSGGGATNSLWGFLIHDWVATAIAVFLGGVSFTIFRQRQSGQMVGLGMMPIVLYALHPAQGSRAVAAAMLCGLLYWIFQKMPDDLELDVEDASVSGRSTFRFFRGDRALIPLNKPLNPKKVGNKAATLAQLRAWGYPVPSGWVLPPGDDPAPLIEKVPLSEDQPYAVRSSAMGEDSAEASAAGQYLSLLDVTNKLLLGEAIARCFASYNAAAARQYRRDRDLPEEAMAVIVQRQIEGIYSGVAFSRDPVTQEPGVVLIEAVAGPACNVVSGKLTPERYRAYLPEALVWNLDRSDGWKLPERAVVELRSDAGDSRRSGQVPQWLIEQVAYLTRHLEARHHGIPQDIEWTYDGEQLWLLQSRPITTLLPMWTRKIAAEVIPGAIHPLTWSINQPLTCGVWGDIFSVVLKQRAEDLDFSKTATLHHAHAYFNASLLGDIFLRMGLPPESLEFLTRGAKFSKPPLKSTLKSLPGLLRLLGRELSLERQFERDRQLHFQPLLQSLQTQEPTALTLPELWSRIELILEQLERATYYSILAPLSAAVRQGMFKVVDEDLDYSTSPEIASLSELRAIAAQHSQAPVSQGLLSEDGAADHGNSTQENSTANTLQAFLKRYGYLSQSGTDIAIPTWKEDPRPIEALLKRYQEQYTTPDFNPEPSSQAAQQAPAHVQRRIDLKGHATEAYSQLQAELRWCFVEIERRWLAQTWLEAEGDIFFLELSQIQAQIQAMQSFQAAEPPQWREVLQVRKRQFQIDQQLAIASLVYGNTAPRHQPFSPSQTDQTLQGIGASAGEVIGRVRVFRSVDGSETLEPDTIIIVPYTDSGWAPLLAQAVGVVAEVGGRLSHGAIVAREYGIPAVMDVSEATQRLRDGQRIKLDGSLGQLILLEE